MKAKNFPQLALLSLVCVACVQNPLAQAPAASPPPNSPTPTPIQTPSISPPVQTPIAQEPAASPAPNTPTPTPIQTQSPKPSPTQTSLEVAQKTTNSLPPTQTYDLRVITNQLWGRLTKITFGENSIIVTMAITNGRQEVVRLNVKDGIYLEDNTSYNVRYNLLPPSNNTEIMIKPGTTLKGQFVFVGWLAPGATHLSLKSSFPCSSEGKNGKEIQQCSGISFNIPINR
ncbi:hypothetical protein QUA56_20305 [Microcoleus sp. N3A4]|uniref:hypothetical protein n=1 Tax=Microcoleus sp. N3A4 TaxID=3055379 RepID=UPI002FD45D67